MSFKLKSFLPLGTDLINVDIYGHSSRSVPGLEIIGLGTKGKLIREKITFISNNYLTVKKSLKKYTISVESELSEDKLKANSPNLEFPILILYLAMADIIPLRNLSNCWATGRVSIDFEVSSPLIKAFFDFENHENIFNNRTLICRSDDYINQSNQSILWEDIIASQLKAGAR